ncbi:MAG TPA: hypothetical protein VFW68_11930 [Rhodocyclaceae bacterium]|nr:hypothetical protein [Rhodocyclaceae bacterium]
MTVMQAAVPSLRRLPATMPDTPRPFADHLAALSFLGLARYLEWQGLVAQTVLIEWSQARRAQQYWQPPHTAMGDDHFISEPVSNFADVMTTWCMGAVRGQLAAAQGLRTYCALPYLDLPNLSGRRHTDFDYGRRQSAVVIDFPDRRRPESAP